jgi:Tfp pilus assembly protein PilO
VRDKLTAWVRRPLQYLAAGWNRMAPRERRLVSVLGGVLGGALFLAAGFLVYQTISELEEQNEAAREALAAVARHRDEFLDAKAKMLAQEMRIGNEAPQVTADLEVAARNAGFQIAESVPRPAAPVNKRYIEHRVDVTLRNVDLQSLSKFLRAVETGPRLIFISQMQIRRGYAEGDKLNVTLIATAFEKAKETAPKRRPGAVKERT